MSKTPKALKIASQIYESRDLLRRIWPEKYRERTAQYAAVIKRRMEEQKCSDLDALILLLKQLQREQPQSGMVQNWFLAAYAEMVEPSQ